MLEANEKESTRSSFERIKDSYLESKIKTQLREGFCSVNKLLRWRCKENNRYYVLLLGVDLLMQVILVRSWGSNESKQGGEKKEIVSSAISTDVLMKEEQIQEIAQQVLNNVATIFTTRKHHGYELEPEYNIDIDIEEEPDGQEKGSEMAGNKMAGNMDLLGV
mgnify:CR=1 FL=1